MSGARAELMRSLMTTALRQQLDDLGRQVGAPVVYLSG